MLMEEIKDETLSLEGSKNCKQIPVEVGQDLSGLDQRKSNCEAADAAENAG